MTFTKILNIDFKGHRTYLQSANVWDAVAAYLRSEDFAGDQKFTVDTAELDIIFKTMITYQVELILSETRPAKDPNMVAQVIVKAEDGTKMLGILRHTDAAISGRFEDIENQFKPDVILSKNQAIYDKHIPVSLSQMFVAMIKFWHQAYVDNDCKWLATRLQLNLSYFDAMPSKLTVSPTTLLKDGQGSICAVNGDEARMNAGRIYFYKGSS